MLDKHILSNMVCTELALKFVVWIVPDYDGGRFSCYHIPIRLVCNIGWNNFHFNTMSVALLAISSFGSLILLPFNTDPPVKFLIIIFVMQEINFV